MTRRTNRTRTVNKDSGWGEEFEKFSFALDEPFSPAFPGGAEPLPPRLPGRSGSVALQSGVADRAICKPDLHTRFANHFVADALPALRRCCGRYCGRA